MRTISRVRTSRLIFSLYSFTGIMRTISRMTSRLIYSLYSFTVCDNEDDIKGDFEIDI